MMATQQQEIRTILAEIADGTVLLPGSVVAEVIDFTAPKPYNGAPAWLLGEVGWSDWSVPVISFARLAGTSHDETSNKRSRIMVLKSLAETSSAPYLGILINGVPRMAKVNPGSLTKPKRMADYPCVFREVTITDQQAVIPEMDKLTRLVEETLADLQPE